MTRDEIIRMAREAGFSEWAVRTPQDLERFAALVAAAEREACARGVEIFDRTFQTGGGIAGSIRSRGNK